MIPFIGVQNLLHCGKIFEYTSQYDKHAMKVIIEAVCGARWSYWALAGREQPALHRFSEMISNMTSAHATPSLRQSAVHACHSGLWQDKYSLCGCWGKRMLPSHIRLVVKISDGAHYNNTAHGQSQIQKREQCRA